MKSRRAHGSFSIACAFLLACNSPHIPTADTIYMGGNILTMAGDSPEYADALAVRDGEIVFVGNKNEAMDLKSDRTRMVDLDARTLLPGFFDSHSHFYLNAIKLSTVNLDPPPAGSITDIPSIQRALADELVANPHDETQWLFGWGYDNGMLRESRHPTKKDLDEVSTEVPIAAIHFSTHMLVLNSKALEELGIDADSIAPEGGVIRRMPNSQEPSGIIEEQAIMPVLMRLLGGASGETLDALLDRSQQQYMSQGFTSISEMALLPAQVVTLRTYASRGNLKLDLLSAVMAVAQPAEKTALMVRRGYEDHFRVAGGKINLDGGSPGRTSFLREPYFTQSDGVAQDYRGYPSMPEQADLNALIESFYEHQIPIYIHALGDAAIDQAIGAIASAESRFARDDIRTQLIHLQVFQPDQMDRLEDLDVTLSFQNTHNYYFADFHNEFTLGPERTAKLCPLESSRKRGFSVSVHHDAPVHPVNQLKLVWIAANRSSRSGKIYGPEERLSVYHALRAATIEGAYQHREESRKGSLEVGKSADLVILDSNPLEVPIEEIDRIQVLETIKRGETIWTRDAFDPFAIPSPDTNRPATASLGVAPSPLDTGSLASPD